MRRDWFCRIAAVALTVALVPVALPVNAETGSSETTSTASTGRAATSGTVVSAPSSKASRSSYNGDDALPGPREVLNNPYAQAQVESGDLAYVPPTVQETGDAKSAGEELRSILGEEIYNRRVNIITPPDTAVEEVIRLLSEKANLNFLYSSGVIKGSVTLNLKDVPLGVALQSLLSSQQLSIVREGENVMRIAPRLEVKGSAVELKTIYIKLNWVPAQSLQAALKSAIKGSQGGDIVAQEDSNVLIVSDTPGNVALIRDLVAQLDVPEKQVMIEARMVELLIDNNRSQGSRTTIEKDGVSANAATIDPVSVTQRTNADGSVTNVYTATGGSISNLLGNTAFGAPVDSLVSRGLGNALNPSLSFGGTVGIFGKEFAISSVLDALEQRRVVNTLTNPRVITLNNQEAEIDIKRQIPYTEAQQGVSQGVTAVAVQFKDAGVKLKVTPNITNSGFIRMKLEPEQKIDAGRGGPNGDIPIIDTRKAVTNVIVKDEDTVVVGGLREVNSSLSRSFIPWLGEVPALGWFFKSQDKVHRKNELMLFVTPHIIKTPLMSPTENYKYSRIDTHWDLPDYFFDDSIEQREAAGRLSEIDQDPRSYGYPSLRLPNVK